MAVYTVKRNGRPLLCRRSSVKPAEFKTYAAAEAAKADALAFLKECIKEGEA